MPDHEFIEFIVDDNARFAALCRVFAELKKDKEASAFRDEKEWLAFFDDKALSHFWWPSEQELADYRQRWRAAPVELRISGQGPQAPGWDFFSMISAFHDGEYELVACRMVSLGRARLEFSALAWPYGGTGCIQALIEAFGFQIIAEDDGTGYRTLS